MSRQLVGIQTVLLCSACHRPKQVLFFEAKCTYIRIISLNTKYLHVWIQVFFANFKKLLFRMNSVIKVFLWTEPTGQLNSSLHGTFKVL